MKDDEAVVTMVDSNLQRERISPSEKAFAYKMKYDAIKRKAGRKNCGQVDHQIGKRSVDIIGELCGDSGKQVQRYIKITNLIPALLDKVDAGTLGFTPAVQISYLKKNEQKEMLDAMEFTQSTPSLDLLIFAVGIMPDIFSDFIESCHSPLDYVKGINTTGAVRSVFIYTFCDPFGTITCNNLDAG